MLRNAIVDGQNVCSNCGRFRRYITKLAMAFLEPLDALESSQVSLKFAKKNPALKSVRGIKIT